jgi:hypothetical protein
MKKMFLTTVLLATAMLSSFAQQVSHDHELMKVQASGSGEKYLNNIPVKAARDFLHRYTDASEAQWYKVKDVYVVICKQDSVAHRIVYSRAGRWIYTIKWYGENKLPKQVRALVRSTWYDYAIKQVEEVQQPGDPVVYVVHLEDATSWKNVSVCEMQLKEIATYSKEFTPAKK